MVLVFGVIALDTTRTPYKTVERVLGGPASYSGIAASFFTKVDAVGVIGEDFPQSYIDTLSNYMDISGIRKKKGKTFFFDSTFDHDLGKRFVNKTETNVTENYVPMLLEKMKYERFAYVGNNNPKQIMSVLDQLNSPRLTVADTIKYWIENKRQQLIKMFERIDVIVLNDDEARMITMQSNLVKCAKNIMEWGPKYVVIKKGEHGAILFMDNGDLIFPAPAFPLEEVVDPTGAGDSFGGGFIGHIERINNLSERTLKEAVIYGNVMGSFVVEDFSINRFLKISINDIQQRFEKYRSLVSF
ncbi:sugar kinase [miscellaneous Crenarchaeota group archaeon SMTZ-80]|nr:MAG: sugar kinase [miscellaneous Crenarchaeota group archaeon SMTZ-80]